MIRAASAAMAAVSRMSEGRMSTFRFSSRNARP